MPAATPCDVTSALSEMDTPADPQPAPLADADAAFAILRLAGSDTKLVRLVHEVEWWTPRRATLVWTAVSGVLVVVWVLAGSYLTTTVPEGAAAVAWGLSSWLALALFMLVLSAVADVRDSRRYPVEVTRRARGAGCNPEALGEIAVHCSDDRYRYGKAAALMAKRAGRDDEDT